MKNGIELLANGDTRGVDPRTLGQDALRDLGHTPKSPFRALRERCLECCSGSSHEVRCCTVVRCPAWPFRTGKNPWRAPASEAQREAGRSIGTKHGRKSARQSSGHESSEGTEGGATHLPGAPFADPLPGFLPAASGRNQ